MPEGNRKTVNDMKQNDRQEKQELTSMQKQAVLVCAVCAVAILLTAGITLVLIKRGKTPKQSAELPSVSDSVSGDGVEDISDHYQISQDSSALLGATADAGASYQEQTLFLGDSNTVRLYANGLISLQQFCAKEGIGTVSALNEQIVTFKRDDNRYTIPQAVAKMKPRRVVLTFGTNDTGMTVDEFIGHYKKLVQAIQTVYPYTDIIINTIPPVPAEHANYPQIEQTKIDDMNMALLSMCEELEIKFLNSAEALKDETGYGKAEYYQNNDIHFKSAGLKAVLSYLRTHAYESADRRPDTTNIPTRAEYTPDPSSAVEAPSSSEESTKVLYQASYRVDKNGGGTLSSGEESGKALLNLEITDPQESVEVTAVPDEGYVFVKWSDGVNDKTRTDKDFIQNVDVTAIFAAASIKISSAGKAILGDTYIFKATLNGKYLNAKSICWYANGVEVTEAAGKTTVKVDVDESMLNATFHVYATATYNDCTVTSNALEVTVKGVASSSSSTGAESESGSTSSSSSSSESASSNSSSSASSASSGSASSSASSKAESNSTSSSASSSASSKTESTSSSSNSSASSKADSTASGSTSGKVDSSSGKAESSSGKTDASSASSGKAESSSSSTGSASASGSSSPSGSGKPASSSGSMSHSAASSSVSSSSSSAASAESKPAASEKTEQPASRKEAGKNS